MSRFKEDMQVTTTRISLGGQHRDDTKGAVKTVRIRKGKDRWIEVCYIGDRYVVKASHPVAIHPGLADHVEIEVKI